MQMIDSGRGKHKPPPRDYNITGPAAAAAVAAGLADAQWYQPPIDPHRLRRLMQRENRRPARDAGLWAALVIGTGVAAFLSLSHGPWLIVPAFAVFGALYGGSADPRWHEHGHATAFRTRWPNDVIYNLASFMLLREPTLWRWSHVRHHSDTLIVGRDPEIVYPRPTRLWFILLNYLNLVSGPKLVWGILQHAVGRLDPMTRELVPADQLRRVVWEARIFTTILLGVLAWAVAAQTITPLLFIGLPSFYGAWLIWFFAITQHAGLREDVLDHRRNTRTVYLNPVFRFLYLNMNYHMEHHMFPGVPYYNLPALHEEIKAYLPPPKRSLLSAYREIVVALWRQRRDPTWEIPSRDIPDEDAGVPRLRSDDGGSSADSAHLLTDLGPVDVIPVGGALRVDRNEQTYALYRLGEETFAVTDGLCTHGKTHLADGYLDGCTIECPKHNGRFDVRTGEAIRRPPRAPLAVYPVSITNGRILADLSPTWPTDQSSAEDGAPLGDGAPSCTGAELRADAR